MVEKWTAADEKLWADLEARRQQVYDRRLDALEEVFRDAGLDMDASDLDGIVANAVEITAALEPFILAGGKFDEA